MQRVSLIIVSPCPRVSACQSSDTWDIRDILDFNDSGSLSSANLLGNSIGVEQAQALLKIKEVKPGLTTLCGLRGDETELDLSGKGLTGPGCAILLAPEMEANGSLSSLDVSSNQLTSTSGWINKQNTYKEGDLAEYQGVHCPVTCRIDSAYKVLVLHGVLALTDAIKDMVSLASVNLLGNEIPPEQAQELIGVMEAKENLVGSTEQVGSIEDSTSAARAFVPDVRCFWPTR
jgi:hypothetical protein